MSSYLLASISPPGTIITLLLEHEYRYKACLECQKNLFSGCAVSIFTPKSIFYYLWETLFSYCYKYQKLPISPTYYHIFCCLVGWMDCPDECRLVWKYGSGGVASVERGQYWSFREGNESLLLATIMRCWCLQLDDYRDKIITIFMNIEMSRSAEMKYFSRLFWCFDLPKNDANRMRQQESHGRTDGRTELWFSSDASVRLLGVVLFVAIAVLFFINKFISADCSSFSIFFLFLILFSSV